MVHDLVNSLTTSELIPAASAKEAVPDRPGYYSIWIDNPNNMPRPYADILRKRETYLVYVGIATKSLSSRLVDQDLNHKNPSTFFRGIGPILGYRPQKGSLVGKSNQNNYKFTKEDTVAIVDWINRHLSVRAVEAALPDIKAEGSAIRQLCPLLNSTHNPLALRELADLRDECRKIARTTD